VLGRRAHAAAPGRPPRLGHWLLRLCNFLGGKGRKGTGLGPVHAASMAEQCREDNPPGGGGLRARPYLVLPAAAHVQVALPLPLGPSWRPPPFMQALLLLLSGGSQSGAWWWQ